MVTTEALKRRGERDYFSPYLSSIDKAKSFLLIEHKMTRSLSEIFKGLFIDYRSVSDKMKHIPKERKGE